MLKTLDHHQFSPALYQTFEVEQGGQKIELVLQGITAFAKPGPVSRAPFSLVFDGPVQCFLPQSIYRLSHPGLGTLEIFLVPIDRNEKGFQYEAIFN